MIEDQIAAHAIFVEHRLLAQGDRHMGEGGDGRGLPIGQMSRDGQARGRGAGEGEPDHGQGGGPRRGGHFRQPQGRRVARQGPSQWLGQDQDPRHRQHHLVAGLVQGQVQQAHEGDQPQDRHLHPAIEQGEQRRHQRQLQRRDMAEVRTLPLGDVLQIGHHHDPDRIDQGLQTMRGDHRRGGRGQAEQAPADQRLDPPARLSLQHRLQGEWADQRQAEQEAAMQIGPEDHQRQQLPARRLAGLPRPQQLHGPERQDRQGQEMRPGQPALGGAGQGQEQGRRAGEGRQLARELRAQDPGQGSHGQGEEQLQT